MTSNPRRLLDFVIPFQFLPSFEKDRLYKLLQPVQTVANEWLFSQGFSKKAIYLLEWGQVELIYEEAPFVRPANVVMPGHYFGERAALLAQNHAYGAKAVTETLSWTLPGEELLELVHRYSIFAQSFRTILRDKHGIFLPLENFHAAVASSLAKRTFRMESLIKLYAILQPALHPFVNDMHTLDLAALYYAVRRLPDNITTVFSWFFTDEVPVLYFEPQKIFPVISCKARRREIWQMLPGKNMVLLRNGISDILDFLSCLCLFAIESQKIRKRLHDPLLLRQLKIFQQTFEEKPIDLKQSAQVLNQQFFFTKEESDALHDIWNEKTLQRLYEITIHHEDWTMSVERQLNNYNTRRSEKWANLVSQGVKDFLGLNPWNLSEDVEVHIVSSNTHSLVNCLSSYPRQHRDEILDWAKSQKHPFLHAQWNNIEDLIYGLIGEYKKTNPSKLDETSQEKGIFRLNEQFTTGIEVQLIDVSKLAPFIDPGLPKLNLDRQILILNIDYAFGEQAGEILRNLITIFPRHIRSVNIIGKAGALVGNRGDILIPTAFIRQTDDSFFSLPEAQSHNLNSHLSHHQVHQGPMLTVAGTLLQNSPLLHFYSNLWKCIGLEMEGVYYARQLNESMELSVLRHEVVQRYYYYVSDLPLDSESQLSKPLSVIEGIPPLYAITREILTAIL